MFRFCFSTIPQGAASVAAHDWTEGLAEHESYCGSRTEDCPLCKVPVALKKMRFHSIALHGGVQIDVGGGTPVLAGGLPVASVAPVIAGSGRCGRRQLLYRVG